MNTRRTVISLQRSFARPSEGAHLKEDYRRCCGIDVHKNSVLVYVLPPVGQPQLGIKKRKFRTFTRDFKQLRD